MIYIIFVKFYIHNLITIFTLLNIVIQNDYKLNAWALFFYAILYKLSDISF